MSRTAQQVMFAGKVPPAALAFQGFVSVGLTTSSNVMTATAKAIGPAAANRTVFALINWDSGSPAKALSSVTIGGIAATIHSQSKGDIGGLYAGVAIVSAQVPTGTTADIVMTFASGAGFYRSYVSTYSCTGLFSLTPVDLSTSYTTGFANHTDNIDVVKDGILLAAASVFWDLTSSYTGVTRDYNSKVGTSGFSVEGGSLSVTADEANHQVKVSVSGSTNAVMCGASFR